MKITKDQIPIIYTISKDVYKGKITSHEGIAIIVFQLGMNKNSAIFYMEALICMLDGKVFKRNINGFAMVYYLDNILKDFGVDGLGSALSAIKLHIDYLTQLNSAARHKPKKIFDRYVNLVSETIDEPDEKYPSNKLQEINDKDLLGKIDPLLKQNKVLQAVEICAYHFRDKYPNMSFKDWFGLVKNYYQRLRIAK